MHYAWGTVRFSVVDCDCIELIDLVCMGLGGQRFWRYFVQSIRKSLTFTF